MKKSIVKEALMKRKAKIMAPKEEIPMEPDGEPTAEYEDETVEAEGKGDKEPLTLKIEGEEQLDKEKDLAPGKPAKPTDEGMDPDKQAIIDAFMDRFSEDEVKNKMKYGKPSLFDRMRNHAMKLMKEEK